MGWDAPGGIGRRRAAGVALTLLAMLAVGCTDVRVPTPGDDQLVGTVSVVGGWIFSPGARPVEDGEVLVPLEYRETLLADTLADQHDWNDERLRDTGTWQIPLDQVEAAEGRLVRIDDGGQFVFDEVEPGAALVCRGGKRPGRTGSGHAVASRSTSFPPWRSTSRRWKGSSSSRSSSPGDLRA